jgi:NTP pyrophosphatase (non-canonical NTP hydrolase)
MIDRPKFITVTDKALDHFGEEKQIEKLKEELQELIDALTKYHECGEIAAIHVAEEFADVYIMTHQIIKSLSVDKDVDAWINAKIKRLEGIVNAETK